MAINIPETKSVRVVIVGGGFAGLTVARQLNNHPLFQVVLIDRNNFHQFQPLYYQVAMSGLEPSSIVFPFRKMFQKSNNVFVRVAEVQAVDPASHRIETSLGPLQYDILVLATGVETNFFGNDSIRQHAIPMKSVSEALYLRNAILEDYEKAITTLDSEERQRLLDIVIVGGGPTGVELAGALAEMKQFILPKDYKELDSKEIDLYLIQGGERLLEGMSATSGKKAEAFLEHLGIHIIKGHYVTDFDGRTVTTNKGMRIPTGKVIWAAGISGVSIKGIPGEFIGRGKRMLVDEFNQIKGLSDVYALGDIALMETATNAGGDPQVAQVAIQQARQLSKNIIAKQAGQPMRPFRYLDKGSMATIGRHLAVVDLPWVRFQGFFAWLVWLFVHLFALIGTKNKVFVFINWVWNYFSYDQSLRLIIKPKIKSNPD